MRQRPTFQLAPALLLPILGACAAAPERADEADVRDLVEHGRYVEALRVAERRASERPADPDAERDYRLASVAVLLESCRRACFEDRDEEALGFARQARAIAPGDRVVEGWYAKMLAKLADRARAAAIEAHAADDLERARQKYEEALRYDPDDLRARDGIAHVLLQINHRAGMGEAYYREGAQALSAYFLHEARSFFSYTIKYQPANERATDRRGEVSGMLADDRAAIAADLEARGLYAAAENEYRIALLIDPTLEIAIAGRERTSREAEAARVLAEAQRLSLKGRFDEARALLREKRSLTEVQAEAFDAALEGVEQDEHETLYREAVTYQQDARYPEASDAFGKLLARADYYKDAISRKEVVDGLIELAAERYQAALAAPTAEEQISLLRGIEVFWPDYQDVRARLKELGASPP